MIAALAALIPAPVHAAVAPLQAAGRSGSLCVLYLGVTPLKDARGGVGLMSDSLPKR